MKLLLPVETAARRMRDNLFAALRTQKWFRFFSLLTIKEDILLVTKQFDDHRLTFSPHETIGRELYRNGHYQRDLAERVLELVGTLKSKTLLELGANIGTHSVYFMCSGKFDRVISIEPDPRNLELLRSNLNLNDISDRVIVVGCAAGDREGCVDLYFGDDNFGGSTIVKTNRSGHSIQVPIRRVDNILADVGFKEDDIGLVWMDIEGAEPEALKSMIGLVERRVPILMEYSPWRYGPEKTKDLANFLAGAYKRCIVFNGKSEHEMDIRAVTGGQQDILLLS